MSLQISIPRVSDDPVEISLEEGEVVFVVGANGTGKSALMHRLFKHHKANARRIAAHRQTWLSSSAITLTPEQKRTTEERLLAQDAQPQARWSDPNAAQRPSIALFDLVDAENVRAREVTKQVEEENVEAAQALARQPSPVSLINRLLAGSNIPVGISIERSSELIARRDSGVEYGVAEMSDGERNALLIASEILTADPGALILVDEPERHLHRSISSPLLRQLFSRRSDCFFVVSTHDVSLPMDYRQSKTVVLSGCTFASQQAQSWEVGLIPPGSAIGEQVRRDVLGGRRQVLFVEGTPESLDKPLYDLLFPHMSVVAKESSRDVIQAVRGIRASGQLHWVKAVGIIDGDGRSETNRERLADEGIFALPAYAVESIYYHPSVARTLADRLGEVTGQDAEAAVEAGRKRALEALAPHADRLARSGVHHRARERVLSQAPTAEQIEQGGTVEIALDIDALVATETARLREALNKGDLGTIVQRYPVRETPALNRIARALGFQSRDQYERAVLQYVGSSPDTAMEVLDIIGLVSLAAPSLPVDEGDTESQASFDSPDATAGS